MGKTYAEERPQMVTVCEVCFIGECECDAEKVEMNIAEANVKRQEYKKENGIEDPKPELPANPFEYDKNAVKTVERVAKGKTVSYHVYVSVISKKGVTEVIKAYGEEMMNLYGLVTIVKVKEEGTEIEEETFLDKKQYLDIAKTRHGVADHFIAPYRERFEKAKKAQEARQQKSEETATE